MKTGRPPRSSTPRAAVVAIVFALALIGIEAAARAVIILRLTYGPDSRAAADSYGDASWPAAYYREFRDSGVSTWHPYVLWRRQPYAGSFINVDRHGRRVSWQPPPGPGSATVFAFGGSTAWGTGARDEHTAPSELAKALSAGGRAVQITNFGESGYVMRQSIDALLGELLAGERPNVVVFQIGVEDAFAAFQGALPGHPQNEENRAVEFNALQPDAFASQWRMLTTGSRLLGEQLRRAVVPSSAAQAAHPDAEGLLRHLCEATKVVTALGNHYGFAPVVAWQPVLFTKRRPTAYERSAVAQYQGAAAFFASVYERVGHGNWCDEPAITDLSSLTDDEAGPMFVDAFHLSELGNQRLAARLAPIVAAGLDRARSPHR